MILEGYQLHLEMPPKKGKRVTSEDDDDEDYRKRRDRNNEVSVLYETMKFANFLGISQDLAGIPELNV